MNDINHFIEIRKMIIVIVVYIIITTFQEKKYFIYEINQHYSEKARSYYL